MVLSRDQIIAEAIEKCAEADKLMIKKSFPFSLFHTHDPSAAADLYFDAGNNYCAINFINESIYCHEKCAQIYSQKTDEYSKSKAAQSYTTIAGLYIISKPPNEEKAIENYRNASEMYQLCGNMSLAASRRLNVFDLYSKQKNTFKAGQELRTVIEMYKAARMNATAAVYYDQYLEILIELRDYRTAMSFFIEKSKNKYEQDSNLLCAFICAFLTDQVIMVKECAPHTFYTSDESKIFDTLLNNDLDSYKEAIRSYSRCNSVRNLVQNVFKAAESFMSPENDIC